MYVKLSIPERLKDLRVVDKHLTLEQLANETGLSRSALAKYEGDGYKDISPFAIATLADFYGVSADYLMGLTENKEIPNIEVQSLHLNDSMTPKGSKKDRHACIGQGTLGLDAIANFINHPKLRHLPFYLETPNELPGYAAEIKLLKSVYK